MKHAVKTTLGAYRVINCDGTHVVMCNIQPGVILILD